MRPTGHQRKDKPHERAEAKLAPVVPPTQFVLRFAGDVQGIPNSQRILRCRSLHQRKQGLFRCRHTRRSGDKDAPCILRAENVWAENHHGPETV